MQYRGADRFKKSHDWPIFQRSMGLSDFRDRRGRGQRDDVTTLTLCGFEQLTRNWGGGGGGGGGGEGGGGGGEGGGGGGGGGEGVHSTVKHSAV